MIHPSCIIYTFDFGFYLFIDYINIFKSTQVEYKYREENST